MANGTNFQYKSCYTKEYFMFDVVENFSIMAKSLYNEI